MKYIFLDTNVFMHFNLFDQIDWGKITDTKDYKILISDITLRELDEKKYDKDDKKADRAKKIVSKIEKIIDEYNNIIQNKAKSELIILKAISKVFLEENSLNPDDQDNYLIASMIDYKNKNPDHDIVLITYDSGPKLKAKSFGLNCIKMPEEFLLPKEPSQNDKKLKELQAENLRLKNKIPKLSVVFEDNKQSTALIITEQKFSEENKIIRMFDIEKEYKNLIYKSPEEMEEERKEKNKNSPLAGLLDEECKVCHR